MCNMVTRPGEYKLMRSSTRVDLRPSCPSALEKVGLSSIYFELSCWTLKTLLSIASCGPSVLAAAKLPGSAGAPCLLELAQVQAVEGAMRGRIPHPGPSQLLPAGRP
jgi:hypothetical protein